LISFITGPELRFTTTGHERNLYRGTFQGEVVLICRQVDDFAIGTSTPAVAEQLIAKINSFARTTSNGIGVPTSFGISNRYNGLDVHQTRHYIKLSCETYINRLLSTHGWETPSPNSSDRPDLVPLHPDVATRIALLVGPAEGTPEHHELAQKVGFSYRQLLGELIYAYVIVRVDIGFAVCFLARYSAAPHHEHYLALKNIARYLRTTIHWGIHYWRPAPVTDLPDIPFELATVDPDLPPFPETTLHELVGFVDASHAACLLTRRSVTGYAFCLAGAVVAYKSKLQPVVATSSTEAEFYAAVIAGKLAKYLRSILTDLLFPPRHPTILYEDNQATIAMVNEQRPTSRVRHIATQHFAIQEWRDAGDIKLVHIPGVLNAADQQTKPLAARLHYRHARRLMGHFGPPSLVASSVEPVLPSLIPPLPGEGVDAHSFGTPDPSSSVHRSTPSSRVDSHASPALSPRDASSPCPTGIGCQCSSDDSPDVSSSPETRAPTDHRTSPHDTAMIGLFPSPRDGSSSIAHNVH
jgi:hypothetical protein